MAHGAQARSAAAAHAADWKYPASQAPEHATHAPGWPPPQPDRYWPAGQERAEHGAHWRSWVAEHSAVW